MSLLSQDLSKESVACSKWHNKGDERAKMSHGGWTQVERVRVVHEAEQIGGQRDDLNKSGLATGGGLLASRS